MSAAAEGSSTVEIEVTYDVDDDTPLPDWTRVPGVATVGAPEPRDLDARYLDTVGADLAQAGIAVRRRTGGPDEGWHVKAPAPGGRSETHWPLGSMVDADAVPEVPQSVQDAVAPWARGPFVPLARVRNHRTAYALTDAAGGVVAEFVDDRVRARDERRGVEQSWREWEIELGPAAPTDAAARAVFFAAVEEAVFAVGARPASSGSKLARTLGH